MRKLVYLFLMGLLWTGCHNIRNLPDEVEALWGMDYTTLMSMEKEHLDSVIRLGKKRYPKEHERAFRTRQIEFAYYYYRLDDKTQADSIANEMRVCIKSQRDSSVWYLYKYLLKWALEEKDSAFHYVCEANKLHLWGKRYFHEQMGFLFRDAEKTDSAVAHCLKAMALDTTQNIFSLNIQILDLLVDLKDTRKALDYLNQARQQMKRADIPYYNLIKGDYWMEMHEPDSAMKHYRIATETGNGFMASQAYERMGMIAQGRQSEKEALEMYRKAQRVRNDLYMAVDSKCSTHDFESLKMKNQLNELKVERQKHVILILGLSLLLIIVTGGFVFYLFHRKRISERNRLMQENIVLKQQQELSALREKDARMREELFKRINVFEKLSETEKEKHIQLSEKDWKEVQLMLDSGYDDFTKKLRIRFPMLSEKDINFCCLVKINMSIQSLTDIYCISKNSVSRRKLRLKEKMGIGEDATLDEFLNRFDS